MIAAEFGWTWRDPAWLLLLLLLPVLGVVRAKTRAGASFAAARFLRGPDQGPPAALPRSFRVWGARLPVGLELSALVLGIVALARPVHTQPLPPERQGRDIMLCLDRSSSMAATDLAADQTRLRVGIAAASSFVGDRPDDRFGIVEFARYPDLRCPPTLDHAAVGDLLADVQLVPPDGPEDATGIGTAVAAAAAVLRRSSAAGKVIVLLTDGEENVAVSTSPDEIAPLHAAQLCAELGIRVHAIVVGLGNQKPDGRWLPLDTTAVQQLAATTRGRFFLVRDAAALAAVYREIDALEVTAFAEPRLLVNEGFAAVLLLAITLLALAHWLLRTRCQVLP